MQNMASPSWNERIEFARQALLAEERMSNGQVVPSWIDDRRFWYMRCGADGDEFVVVDAATGQRCQTVTVATLVRQLETFCKVTLDPRDVIIKTPVFELDGEMLSFSAFDASYRYSLSSGELTQVTKSQDLHWLESPDGATALLLRDHDLWLRDIATGRETRLTTDGTETYAYAGPPAVMRGQVAHFGGQRPDALWSPDGRWILTLQTDDRHVPKSAYMEYAPHESLRPKVHSNWTSLPGDPRVTEFRMLAIEVATGRQVEAQYPRLTSVRMNNSPFSDGLVWWSADGRTAYFVHIERGEKQAHVVAFDSATGATRILFTEKSASYVEVSVNVYTKALIAPLPATDELIWYSERTGRGHFYLYDLTTGTLRGAITAGDWQIRDVIRVDATRREVFFTAAGIAADESPYIVKPCRASFDGEVRILSAEAGEHQLWRPGHMGLLLKKIQGLDTDKVCSVSPGGDYFIETVSAFDQLPKTWLRDRDGQEIALLEAASGELPLGWQDPERVECLAADGETTTYGLLFKPYGYDPAGSYPIIDLIYGGCQINNVPYCHFAAGTEWLPSYLDGVHLSALGAFVLILDGRGTAFREQSFRTASYGAVQTASNLEDHIAAIQRLADLHPQIDIDRAGITGFSGGGYMAANAALRFGDFFKVAVAGGGNYDQALFLHCWGERYHGAYDAQLYAAQATKTYAGGMTGKLLLVHSLMDEGCHPAALFQLVQRLIDADKDPDLVILPRARHEWTGYGLRRRWNYFAQHLMKAELPAYRSFEDGFSRVFARVAANAVVPGASRHDD